MSVICTMDYIFEETRNVNIGSVNIDLDPKQYHYLKSLYLRISVSK